MCNKQVPEKLLQDLKRSSRNGKISLITKWKESTKEITNYKSSNISENELNEIYINNENFYFPDDF